MFDFVVIVLIYVKMSSKGFKILITIKIFSNYLLIFKIKLRNKNKIINQFLNS